MWQNLIGWARANPKYMSIGAFFLWSALMAITSPSMGTLWAIPTLLLVHVVSGVGIYFGWLKDERGNRNTVGIILGCVTMIYNLAFDILHFLV